MNESDDPEFKETETPFINGDRPLVLVPERHGCVSAWLILMLIANSLVALLYLFIANKPIHLAKISTPAQYFIIVLAVLNVIFSIQLLTWKKSGFYGYFITSVVGTILNISLGFSLTLSLSGLSGIAILYGILQIKNHGISAWDNLK